MKRVLAAFCLANIAALSALGSIGRAQEGNLGGPPPIFANPGDVKPTEILITADEGKLPSSADVPIVTRGPTRGPGIEQISPRPNATVTSPLPFKVRFEIRNQVEIDLESVRLVYLKASPVDLTSRIRKHLTPSGIEMDKVSLPTGTHLLRLDIKDKQGRAATAILKLLVRDKQ